MLSTNTEFIVLSFAVYTNIFVNKIIYGAQDHSYLANRNICTQ